MSKRLLLWLSLTAVAVAYGGTIRSYRMDAAGTERALLSLLGALDFSEYDITLLLAQKEGPLLPLIPKEVRVTELGRDGMLFSLSAKNAKRVLSAFALRHPSALPRIVKAALNAKKRPETRKSEAVTLFSDLINRYNLRGNEEIGELVDVLASSVGSLTNTLTLTNTFNSIKQLSISRPTVAAYIQYLQDAFLLIQAKRYNVRGRKYIASPSKYYFVDAGLRNARLDFRQRDYGFIMENVIYNALCQSGWNVDVGMVEYNCKEDGKSIRKQLEVDFVCNKGSKRYYIQSAHEITSEDKYWQEIQSFQHIHDSFQRILIQNEDIKSYYDENGIRHIGLFDFLLHPECIATESRV